MAVEIKFIVDGQEYKSMKDALDASISTALSLQRDMPIDRCVKYTTRKDSDCRTILTMTYQMATSFAQGFDNGNSNMVAHEVRGVNETRVETDIPKFRPSPDKPSHSATPWTDTKFGNYDRFKVGI